MPITARIQLSMNVESYFDNKPDRVEVTFDPKLISMICAARAMLDIGVLGQGADITLSMADEGRFLVDEYDGAQDVESDYEPDDDGAEFQVSSGWLKVERERLGFVYWEDNSGYELSGFLEVAEHTELRDAIEAAMPAAVAALRETFARVA